MSEWFLNRPIAHRGLHKDRVIPENSLSSFKKAIEANYPIELDVQIANDGSVVVFHDEFLDRLCGDKRKVSQLKLAELKSLHLYESAEKIPTLKEVLELVDGKVPLLIEVKCLNFTGVLETNIAKQLDNYSGEFAIQSFNPFSMMWFTRNRPNFKRGLLCGSLKESSLNKTKKFLLKSFAFAYLIKPHFIAVELGWFKWWSNLLWKYSPVIFWTVTTSDESEKALKKGQNYIFENFLP